MSVFEFANAVAREQNVEFPFSGDENERIKVPSLVCVTGYIHKCFHIELDGLGFVKGGNGRWESPNKVKSLERGRSPTPNEHTPATTPVREANIFATAPPLPHCEGAFTLYCFSQRLSPWFIHFLFSVLPMAYIGVIRGVFIASAFLWIIGSLVNKSKVKIE